MLAHKWLGRGYFQLAGAAICMECEGFLVKLVHLLAHGARAAPYAVEGASFPKPETVPELDTISFMSCYHVSPI